MELDNTKFQKQESHKSEVPNNHESKSPSKCRDCKEEIKKGAHKCPHCGSYQNFFWNIFSHALLLIPCALVLIAVVQIIINFIQLSEAKKERKKASEAFDVAKQAEKDILELRNEANVAVDSLKEISKFNLLITRAQNDDREAFDDLLLIADDKANHFSDMAWNVLVRIEDKINREIMLGFSINWEIRYKGRKDPNKLNLDQFKELYNEEKINIQPAILKTVWGKRRFTKFERISFVIDAMQNTKSLRVLHETTTIINQEAKLNVNILGYKRYIDWWEKNKKLYE